MAKQLNSYEVKLDFKADTSQAKKEIDLLQQNLSNLITKGAGQYTLGKDLDKEISGAINAVSKLKVNLQEAFNVDTGKLDLGKFQESLNRSGLTLRDYKKQLSTLGPEGKEVFGQLVDSIVQAEIPLKRSNALLTEFWTTLKNTARWQISSSLLHGFMGAMSSAYGYAQDLNESLNNIRIVTGYNVDKMSEFAAAANKAAQALSTTTTSYTDAALIYYQQGLSDEEVLGRTDVTIKLANVARESAETVSDQMTAVWNNFYDGSKSLEYYADVMTALGAATASSTSEISQGLEKFAAVADTVGLSYEYATAALATVTATTRQSADVVGTAFKTLFARLEQLKLGETLDDGTTLGQYSQALEKVGVLIKDDAGNLKDMDDILDELAAKWQTLAKDQQVALAQQVAGVRQYTQLIALMDNWDFMESNLEVARGAEGTLEEQANIYAESWEAAQKRVKAAAEDIYGALLNDEFFIDLNNVLADILKSVKALIDGMGGLKGVLLTLGAIATTVFQKQIANSINNIGYGLRMMTTKGQQSMANYQKEAVGELVDIYNTGNYGKHEKEALVSSTTDLVQLNQQYLSIKNEIGEAERQIHTEQLKNLKTQQQAVVEANKELDILEKQSQKIKEQVTNRYKGTVSKADINKLTKTAQTTGRIEGVEDLIEKAQKETWDKSKTPQSQYDELFKIIFGKDGVSGLQNAFPEASSAIKILKTAIENKDGETIHSQLDEIRALIGKEDYNYQKQIESIVNKATASGNLSEIELKQLKEDLELVAHSYADLGAKTEKTTEQTEAFEAAQKRIRDALAKSNVQNLNLASSFTALISTFTSLASAINIVNGVFDTWKNQDLSFSQKLLTSVSSLGMAYGILSRQVTKDNVVKLAHVGALTLEKLGLDKSAIASMKDAVAKNSEAGAINLATGALSKYIITLGIAVAAIGALIFVIYKIIQAVDRENNKLKDAQEATANLKNNYDTLKNSAEEFHNAIKDYEDGVKSLEDLKDNQEEYNKALEESNQKARELIEKYELFGQYHWENGVIKFDTDDFEHVLEQQEQSSHKAYLNAALYQNKVQQDVNKEDRNLQLLQSGLVLSGNDIDNVFESYINKINNGTVNSIEALQEALNEFNINFDGNLKDIIKAFNEYDSANKKVIDSQKYFTEQYVEAKIKESEANQKFLDIADGNTNKYNSILAASAKLNEQEIDLNSIEDVTQIVSQFGLNDFLREHKGQNAVSDIIGHDYTGPLSGQEIAKIYGQRILGHDNFNVALNDGKATFKDFSGKDLLSETDMSIMAQSIAREIAVAVATELSGIDPEILTGLLEKTDNLDLGFDVSQFLLDSINNGSVDLTTIFSQLTQAEADALDVNKIIEVLRNYPNQDLVNKLLEVWGYNPEDWNKLADDLSTQAKQYTPEDNKAIANAEGEKAAENAGIDVEAYKVYRNEIERTEESLHDQWEAVNDVALANMKLAKGLKTIAGNWEDYNKILTDDNANLQDVAQVLGELKEPLAEILNMDMTELALLPDNFAKENWNLITDAIDGVDGALDDLRDKAGEAILIKVSAEFDANGDGQLDQMYQEIHDKIASYNDANFEVGYHLNRESEAEVFQSFEDIINAAGGMSDELAAYFASMGYDVVVNETEVEPKVTENTFEYPHLDMRATRMAGVPIADGKEVMTLTSVSGGGKAFSVESITTNGNYGGSNTVKKAAARGGGPRGSSGGGGGGKSITPAENQKITSKADAGIERYKEIDDAIQDLTKDQERLNKVTDAYYGANKVAYMKQQHKLLQKEIDLHKERFKWAQKYYDEDKAELDKYAKETLGVEIEYDEDGSIKNYTPIMEGLYSQLNEKEKYWADASHFSSKEEQDEYKKANIDPIADAMNDFQKRVDTFDESNEERKEEMNKGIELMIEFKQQEYEIWQEDWKNQQDILEDQIKFLDHAKKMLGDSAADMGEALALTAGGDNNYVQNALDQLDLYKNKEQELNDLLAANKITQADYVKGMEEIRDGYLEQTENLKALDDEMMEYYGKILDKVISEIKEYTDAMDKLNSQLDRYIKVMKLTGRELDYDAIGDILEAQQKVLNDQYTTDVNTLQMLREREQHWLDELARQTTDEGRELIERQLKETREQLVETENQVLDDLAAQAEKASEILENARAKSMAVYENMLTDGLGFDYVDGLLERQSTLQEEYLTKTNQVFETTKMLRKLQSDMDATNNRAAKQRLSNFSKEIEDLKNRESMTKADLELAQKRYDLLLAEIALEEAQKAKTTVRLQRDNEGNYGYVYTADEGDIAKAQDDLYNAENDLYNTRLRITNEYGEKIIQLNQEQADALNELWDAYYNKHSISEDEYEQKRAEIVNHYNELRKTYVHNYVEAQKQDARVVADAWINQDTNMIKSSETWQKTTDKLIAQTENAIRRYENTSSWLEGQQEIHFGNVEQETQKVTTASNELKDKVNEEVIPAYEDLWGKVDAVYQKYSAERREVQLNIIEYDKLAKQLQVTIDKYRLLAEASNIKTLNSDGDVKGADTEVKDVSSNQTVTANGGTGGKDKTYTSDTPSGPTALSKSEVGKYITEYAKNYSSDVYDKTNVKLDLINGIYYSKEDVKNAVANWMAEHKKQSVVTAAAEAIKKVNGSASQDVGGNNFSRKTAAKMSRASGGYTGEWSDGSGKLAILHSNEIVLNSHDTDNMFGIIDMVREITKTIDVNAAGVIGGYGALSSGSMNAGPQTLEQNVQITASFPNATDHNEIEEAFNNLINKASQYANRTR